ncbi:MAG: hypothetical protein J6H31_03625 [Butyrivibrio sp.]|nr:hypothetical protein [Butyrivibrio sp.]
MRGKDSKKIRSGLRIIKPRIKYNTYRSKEYIIRDKILPYFKNFSV